VNNGIYSETGTFQPDFNKTRGSNFSLNHIQKFNATNASMQHMHNAHT